jgi:hypothetical protein
MATAVRVASISILKIFIQHGGKVEGTNLVAQVALADLWGYSNRPAVIEYLLEIRALINSTIRFNWPLIASEYELKKRMFIFLDTTQTAYNIAQISRNQELENLLLARGADTNNDTIIGYVRL